MFLALPSLPVYPKKYADNLGSGCPFPRGVYATYFGSGFFERSSTCFVIKILTDYYYNQLIVKVDRLISGWNLMNESGSLSL